MSATKQPKWLKQINAEVDGFISKLKRRKIRGSSQVAHDTVNLLRFIIQRCKCDSVQEMLDLLRGVGKRLTAALSIEVAIGNMVRRVLFIIRHECAAHCREEKSGGQKHEQRQETVDLAPSLHKLLDSESMSLGLDRPIVDILKQPINDEISQLMDEINSVRDSIAEQATEHVYAKEVIMTFGMSKTVVAFFKEAAKFRKFEVIVAESAPSYEGQAMAVELGQAGIKTTVITDSAVFALMASVNKVIISSHAVMANGGIIAHTGAHNLAVAAKHHKVPLVVVTGLHKLCPLYAFGQDSFNIHNAPGQILKFEEDLAGEVEVENPGFDYILPDLVELFITNFGGHNPSYIYRLVNEYYGQDDYVL